MNVRVFKSAISATIVIAVVAVVPFIGLTDNDSDLEGGVMIDFGFYNVEWVKFDFTDGMTGSEALARACELKGYDIGKDSSGAVFSVAGRPNLVGVSWGMYVLEGNGQRTTWSRVADPDSFPIAGQRLVSWARASDTLTIMPGTDATGFTYYNYSKEGRTSAGEMLRIATMAPSITETLAAVGGLEMITATDMYSDYPSAIGDGHKNGSVKLAGGYSDPNFEILISLMPDIVFLDGSMGEHMTIADKLRKSGVHCVVLYEVKDVSDLMKNVWIAASAIGFSENGNDYIRKVNITIDSVCNVAKVDFDKVFVALSPSGSTYTPGSGTYMDSMIRSLGANNVFSNSGSSWFMVSKSQVYAKQPDVIVILDSERDLRFDDQSSRDKYSELLNGLDGQWRSTPAFDKHRIIVFSGPAADLLMRPGARLAAAMELLAKSVDPDSFVEKDFWDKMPVYLGSDYHRFLKYQQEGLLT